jgi:DNA-binding winged helix-turn-helix (wHTH) protein
MPAATAKAGAPSRQITFGPFTLDTRAGELFKRGKKIKVQQLPLQILTALVEQPGEVVEREELRTRLWPVDTFVDFEHGLNTAIKKLRTALGESSSKPRYIETLPKKGYRFLGKVDGKPEPAKIDSTADASAISKPATDDPLAGKVFQVSADHEIECVVAPIDTASLDEWQRLAALGDDVGVSMLIAHNRLLLLEVRKLVRVLSATITKDWCEVRVLEGEHYGKTALLPLGSLSEAPVEDAAQR